MFKNTFLPTKVMLITSLALISPTVIGKPIVNGYTPYFGVFARMNHFSWENGFGNNLFRRDVPQAELYVGTQLGEYVSFDIGYQVSATKRKLVTLGKDDVFLTLPVPTISDPPISFLTFVQTKGSYINANAILPLKQIFPSIGSNIGIVGQIGLVHLQVAHRVHTVKDIVDNFDITAFTRFYKNQKVIPRLGLGLQYQPREQTWGLRFMANWENTKRFGQLYIRNTNEFRGIVKMKNSYSYGIGLFCQI